jgi:hypothetical protein
VEGVGLEGLERVSGRREGGDRERGTFLPITPRQAIEGNVVVIVAVVCRCCLEMRSRDLGNVAETRLRYFDASLGNYHKA